MPYLLIHDCLLLCSLKQKVNESGMEDSSPLPPPVHSLQEKQTRSTRSEAPVDSMLKDMATIIFSTFLLAGWVAFIITYPKVKKVYVCALACVCVFGVYLFLLEPAHRFA